MKKCLLFMALCLTAGIVNAQTAVEDTVSVGSGYVNQIWYQLQTENETAVTSADWDIAFKAAVLSATVFVNDNNNVWKYPGAASDWASLDTAGMNANWEVCINSHLNWDAGAFNHTTSNDTFDYGWGTYNMGTHGLDGVAIFVIQLQNDSFKKFFIENHASAGVYTFKYANLDGSNEITETLDKADFTGKNFAYYSLVNEQALNPEPESADWDLYFTRYTEMIAMGGSEIPYVVTGVVMNEEVQAVRVDGVDQENYVDYEAHTLAAAKNTIGYNWKSYNMEDEMYVVEDSTVFFVADRAGSIWKLVFTGFDGAEGLFMLSKTLLETTSIAEGQEPIASLTTYPNPVSDGQFTVVYSLRQVSGKEVLAIYDYAGRLVSQQNLAADNAGIRQVQISTQGWAKGIYFLNLEAGGQTATHKIVVH